MFFDFMFHTSNRFEKWVQRNASAGFSRSAHRILVLHHSGVANLGSGEPSRTVSHSGAEQVLLLHESSSLLFSATLWFSRLFGPAPAVEESHGQADQQSQESQPEQAPNDEEGPKAPAKVRACPEHSRRAKAPSEARTGA
jgi:hypothetical protein